MTKTIMAAAFVILTGASASTFAQTRPATGSPTPQRPATTQPTPVATPRPAAPSTTPIAMPANVPASKIALVDTTVFADDEGRNQALRQRRQFGAEGIRGQDFGASQPSESAQSDSRRPCQT